jgi:hypothetical protein
MGDRLLAHPGETVDVSAITATLRRIGGLLEGRRLTVYCAMLLVGEIVVTAFYVTGTYGLIVPLDRPTSTDFVSFYGAGTLVNSGTPELVYDRAAHHAAEQSATEPGIEYNYFYYPPVFLLLCAALARLPYLISFFVFEIATLGLFLWAATRIVGDWRWTSLLPIVVFPAVFWNFGYGQNAFLTAALFGAGTLLLERRPVISGLLFGALCYKPQFGLLIPIALAAGQHWRTFAAAAGSTALLVLLSLLLFGGVTWHSFFAAAIASSATYEHGVKLAAFVNPFGAVLKLGGTAGLAYAVQACAIVIAAILVAASWARKLDLGLRAAMLAALSIVVAPVALFYDLMLAVVAALWLYRSENRFSPTERTLLALLVIACFDPVKVVDTTGLPIGPCAMFGLVALVSVRAWRKLAAPRLVATSDSVDPQLEPT